MLAIGGRWGRTILYSKEKYCWKSLSAKRKHRRSRLADPDLSFVQEGKLRQGYGKRNEQAVV